jgi:hypothetical protein
MKNVKMSLANIQGKLSRKELKNIMAGSNGCQWGAGKVYPAQPSAIVYCAAGTSGCTVVYAGTQRCLSCGGGAAGACI